MAGRGILYSLKIRIIMKTRFTSASAILIYFFLAIFITGISSCDEDEDTKPAIETGTMTDIENNVYKTVKIGNKWWMAENLKVRKFRNGVAIPLIENDSTGWVDNTTGA